MRLLLDANAVVYVRQKGGPHHEAVVQLVEHLVQQGASLCVCPQVLYEFWVVATRPRDNHGMELSPQACDEVLHEILGTFDFVPEPEQLVAPWRQICVEYGVVGKRAHDARLAALVRAAELDGLVSLDAAFGFGVHVVRPGTGGRDDPTP